MIISTAGSKTGDKDFHETVMKEYNKKLDEYNTFHFADDIVVDDKNQTGTSLLLTGDLTNVHKEVTVLLDKFGHDSMLSGRNGTVKLPQMTKNYLIYWNLFANQDPERLRHMHRELPVDQTTCLGVFDVFGIMVFPETRCPQQVPKARTCVKNTTSPPRQDQLWSGT
jgi:hypothetical protein